MVIFESMFNPFAGPDWEETAGAIRESTNTVENKVATTAIFIRTVVPSVISAPPRLNAFEAFLGA